MFIRSLALFTLIIVAGGIVGADAQSPLGDPLAAPQAEGSAITLPDPLTPETIDALMSRLSDEDVRGILIDQLNVQAAADAEAATEAGMNVFVQMAQGVVSSVTTAIQRLPIVASSLSTSFRNFGEKLGGDGLLRLALVLAAGIVLGLVAETAVRRITREWQERGIDHRGSSLTGTLGFLGRRFVAELLGLGLYLAVTSVLAHLFLDQVLTVYLWLIVLQLILQPRATAAVSRIVTAPQRPEFRLLSMEDRWAKWLHGQLILLAFFFGVSVFFVEFNALNDVPVGGSRLGFWLNLIVHLHVIYIAWRGRDALSRLVRGGIDDASQTDERLSRIYPVYCMTVSFCAWILVSIVAGFGLFHLLIAGAHYITMAVLIVAPVLDTGVRGVVHHVVPPMQGTGAVAAAAYADTKRSYIRIARVIIFVSSLSIIAGVWGIDFVNIAGAGVGIGFARSLIEFMMIAALGYLVYELVSLLINRKLAAERTAAEADNEEASEGEGGGGGSSRLSTVLPLVRTTAQVAVVIVFTLLALGQAGVDTTPLLAGAGIAGLAIGFGAQKLVTDVVSGLFFLIDDAFRTGEYVEIEGTMGTVEKISVRSMQLRHHLGPVHTVPYGEIPKITNYSRDWVILKLKFTVDFDTDPNRIKKIFKRIGAEMAAAEEFKDDFLQPFKSQGVFDFSEVGMIVRGKFMAKPGKQFTIRKEIFNRVKAAFAENGIEFARREVRVALPDDFQASEETKEAVAAAATEVAQQQSPPVAGASGDR